MERKTWSPGPAVDDLELTVSGGGRLTDDNINFTPKRAQQVRIVLVGEVMGYSEKGKHPQAGLVTTGAWSVKAESLEIVEFIRHNAREQTEEFIAAHARKAAGERAKELASEVKTD